MPPPVKRKGIPRGAKIAIIVGVIALVLVAVIVVLAVFLFINVLSKPADVANNYMLAIQKGDLSSAYDYLSESTKADTTRSQFNTDKSPFEGQIARYRTTSINIQNGNAWVGMDLTLANGETATWFMQMVKEGEDWKLLNIDTSKPTNWPED